MRRTQKAVVALAANILKTGTSHPLFDSSFELILQDLPDDTVIREVQLIVSGDWVTIENEDVIWGEYLFDALDGACKHLYKVDLEYLWCEKKMIQKLLNVL